MFIRYATIDDMKQVLAIYAYYVKHSCATFAYEIPTLFEYQELFMNVYKEYPFLVCVEHNQILGYAYAHKHKEKEAYQWNVEITIYIDVNKQKQHIGSNLLEVLLDLLKQQHICNVYACITIPNEASIAVHQKFGFQEVARFFSTGFKQGQWLDVVWLQYKIHTPTQPQAIKRIQDIKKEESLMTILPSTSLR